MAYDEHEVNNTFKFGVVYQKFGQVSGPDGSLLNRVKQFQDELNIFVQGKCLIPNLSTLDKDIFQSL